MGSILTLRIPLQKIRPVEARKAYLQGVPLQLLQIVHPVFLNIGQVLHLCFSWTWSLALKFRRPILITNMHLYDPDSTTKFREVSNDGIKVPSIRFREQCFIINPDDFHYVRALLCFIKKLFQFDQLQHSRSQRFYRYTHDCYDIHSEV